MADASLLKDAYQPQLTSTLRHLPPTWGRCWHSHVFQWPGKCSQVHDFWRLSAEKGRLMMTSFAWHTLVPYCCCRFVSVQSHTNQVGDTLLVAEQIQILALLVDDGMVLVTKGDVCTARGRCWSSGPLLLCTAVVSGETILREATCRFRSVFKRCPVLFFSVCRFCDCLCVSPYFRICGDFLPLYRLGLWYVCANASHLHFETIV